jgi:hypothetical protein
VTITNGAKLRSSNARPHRTRLPDAIIAAILHQRYCLVPCTVDLFFGPANVTPLLFYPSLLTALLVVYLLSATLPTLLLHLLPHPFSTLVFSPKLITVCVKPMAQFLVHPGLVRHFTSHWPQQVLGHKLLLGLSSHLNTALSCTHPASTRPIQRHNLQTSVAIPRVLRPTFALSSAFFYPTNLVTVSSTA